MKEFLQQYNILLEKAQVLIPAEMKKQLTERENRRCSNSDWNLQNIDDEGITFVQEYNDHCQCHPEYRNAYLLIKWESINVDQK